MNIGQIFPSKYVSSGDLNGEDITVTIQRARIDEIEGEDCLMLSFEGRKKDFVVNKTNAKSIAKLHGDETDDWIGKQITLYQTQTEYKGEMVDCIRIRGNAGGNL